MITARAGDHPFASGLGADHAIDFSAGDHVPRVRALGGVDVVLDTVGGNTLAHSQDVLADRGRVVSIADTIEPQNLLAEWGVIATYHWADGGRAIGGGYASWVRGGPDQLELFARLVS